MQYSSLHTVVTIRKLWNKSTQGWYYDFKLSNKMWGTAIAQCKQTHFTLLMWKSTIYQALHPACKMCKTYLYLNVQIYITSWSCASLSSIIRITLNNPTLPWVWGVKKYYSTNYLEYWNANLQFYKGIINSFYKLLSLKANNNILYYIDETVTQSGMFTPQLNDLSVHVEHYCCAVRYYIIALIPLVE